MGKIVVVRFFFCWVYMLIYKMCIKDLQGDDYLDEVIK